MKRNMEHRKLRKQCWCDLGERVRDWKEEGNSVIVSMDANLDVTKENSDIRTFMQEHSLVDPVEIFTLKKMHTRCRTQGEEEYT